MLQRKQHKVIVINKFLRRRDEYSRLNTLLTLGT